MKRLADWFRARRIRGWVVVALLFSTLPARAEAQDERSGSGLHYTGATGRVESHLSAELEADERVCPTPWRATPRTVEGALPPGLSFDPHDGDIEGTPRKAGTWRVRILLEDVRCGDHAPGSVAVPVTFTIEPFEPRQVFERPERSPPVRETEGLTYCGSSVAYDVNDAGWIVGSVQIPDVGMRAVAWVGDSIVRLGALGEAEDPDPRRSEARAVNEIGQIVGTGFARGDLKEHGFLWRAGRMTRVPEMTEAVGIDDRGRIVGNQRRDGGWRALVYRDGATRALPPLDSDRYTRVRSMNARGQAVGQAAVRGEKENFLHAVVWDEGRAHDLTPDAWNSAAAAISNVGHVVGTVQVRPTEYHAFLWKDGDPRDLGLFGAPRQAVAIAVDDRSRVVVNVDGREGDPPRWGTRAVLVDGDRVVDLGKLRPDDRETEAHAMNNRGIVVGRSGGRAFAWENGTMRALPSPVPCRERPLRPPPERPVAPRVRDDVDMDGVRDEDDKCPNTPRGVDVGREGCRLPDPEG